MTFVSRRKALAHLDCLLAHPDANWLATGAEKLQYFFDRGYDEEELRNACSGTAPFTTSP